MSIDSIPVSALFVGTILLVLFFIEVGYRMGHAAHRASEDEKESPVSVFAGALLGLVAFMLAFTFGIVSNRYDARRELVRNEANAIGTAYLRADFLPEPDRSEAKRLFKEYLDERLAFAHSGEYGADRVNDLVSTASRIQRQLWDMAVANARKDMNSDVAALYIESLNEVIDIHALRLAVGVQARVPMGIWGVLYGLTVLGMIGIGYHAGIAGSKRSKATLFMALAFAMVIGVIASLDRQGGFIKVTQQPLADLQRSLESH